MILPVVITVFSDKSFTFILKSPPASVLLKKAANIASGSAKPNQDKVGKVTKKQLAEICQMCCERVRTVVELLTNVKRPAAILKLCEEIDRLESDADRVMRSALSKLFREESDVKQVMKLRVIYELLETITDRCEDVANVIEGIVLENS